MTKHWPRPREIVFLMILHGIYKDSCFNIGDAVEALAPLAGGKRLAARIIRGMARLGLLQRCKPLWLRALPLEEALRRRAAAYAARRMRRHGIDVEIEVEGETLVAVVRGDAATCAGAARLLEALGVRVMCYSSSS